MLEAQRRKLGRVVYCPSTSARLQEPTTIRSWYKQNLRWLWGAFQGILGHKVGRRATMFDLAYGVLIIDWLLFAVVTPVILGVVVATNVHDPGRLAHLGILYVAGCAAWSLVGAIALRKWRQAVLWPALLVIDWISRVNLVHAALKALRQPTSECRWESPARYAVAARARTPLLRTFFTHPYLQENIMSTSLTTSTGAAGDGFLPVTGFGPGSILIALIGGALTLFGAIVRRLGRQLPPAI